MLNNQEVRRNMSDAESIYVEKKISEQRIMEENEKKRLEGNRIGGMAENQKEVSTRMDADLILKLRDRSTNTREQIAKAAKVSTGTVSLYDRVMKSDDDELKQNTM